MFRSIYEVKIEGKDIRRFIQKLYRCNIYFEDIDIYDRVAYVKLTSENYKKFITIIKDNNIKVKTVEAGQKINIEKNLFFDVLWPNRRKYDF